MSSAVSQGLSLEIAGVGVADARTILTPASGFIRRYRYSLDPYSGCRFACEY